MAPLPDRRGPNHARFELPARFIIHTVGPVWHGGGHGEARLLESAYQHCIDLADANGLRTIAFPALSCGIFGYPWGRQRG